MYESSGYQIVQGLFASWAGGWFGMGLCQGSPEMIPFVKQDYMFAAICEELGGLFAICMILICMSMFLLVVNISLRIKKRFYKLIALGLGTEYAFQVFLTIGGVSKFIPMTGITLPLVRLRRKFCTEYHYYAGHYSGLVYFKRRRGRGT